MGQAVRALPSLEGHTLMATPSFVSVDSIFDAARLRTLYSTGVCESSHEWGFARELDKLAPKSELAGTKISSFSNTDGTSNRAGCCYAHCMSTCSLVANFGVFDLAAGSMREQQGMFLWNTPLTRSCQKDVTQCAEQCGGEPDADFRHSLASLEDRKDDFTRQATTSTTDGEFFRRQFSRDTASSSEQKDELDGDRDGDGEEAKHDSASCSTIIKLEKDITPPLHLGARISKSHQGNAMVAEAKFIEPLFIKTKLCKFNMHGTCNKGSKCRFAHDQAELRPTPDFSHPEKPDLNCMKQHVPESTTIESLETTAAGPACPLGRHTPNEVGKQFEKNLVFFRTKLCKFHASGFCSRGQTCKFAHDEALKRPLPNLSCTRMCPNVDRAEGCKDATCRFAHSIDELRVLLGNSMKPWGCQDVPGRLVVKNTFLNWDFPTSQLRCSVSTPEIRVTQ